MKSEPLSAGEHLALLIFCLLCLALCFGYWFGGFIPAVLLGYGYVMMRINGDFAHVDVTVKYTKLYFNVLMRVSIAAAFLSFLWLLGMSFSESEQTSNGALDAMLVFVGVSILMVILQGCLLAVQHFYHAPLLRHKEWVETHGAFSRKSKKRKQRSTTQAEADISENAARKQYSVADELSKWANLRDEGVVSDADFERARSKLLQEQ